MRVVLVVVFFLLVAFPASAQSSDANPFDEADNIEKLAVQIHENAQKRTEKLMKKSSLWSKVESAREEYEKALSAHTKANKAYTHFLLRPIEWERSSDGIKRLDENEMKKIDMLKKEERAAWERYREAGRKYDSLNKKLNRIFRQVRKKFADEALAKYKKKKFREILDEAKEKIRKLRKRSPVESF